MFGISSRRSLSLLKCRAKLFHFATPAPPAPSDLVAIGANERPATYEKRHTVSDIVWRSMFVLFVTPQSGPLPVGYETLYPFEYLHCLQLLQNSTDNTVYLHLAFSCTCFQHNPNSTINRLSNYSLQLTWFHNSPNRALHSSQLATYNIGATPV